MTQILKRLEIIKSSIAIEEDEIIELQVMKLNKIDIDDEVKAILTKLEDTNYSEAIKDIENYLSKYSGVVEYVDSEIQGLKLELKSLESNLQKLTEQKTEYLNDIEEFNTQYNLHLGKLIKEILELKKEILYKQTIKLQKKREKYQEDLKTFEETKETIDELNSTISELEEALETIDEDDENYEELSKAYAELKEEVKKLEEELETQEEELSKTKEFIEDETIEEEYEEVKSHYEEYENQYNHIQKEQDSKIKISDDEKKELKKLFRKAARLCHPDIVIDKLKEKAHDLMQKLNDAYSKQDLVQVKKILHTLESGESFEVSSDAIEDKELLKEKIKEYKQNIQNIESELEEIKEDDTYQTISNLDSWDEYFEELKSGLEAEKEKLEEEAREVLEEKEPTENTKTIKPQPKKSTKVKTKNITKEDSLYTNHIQNIENIKFERIRKYCENLSKENQADDMQKYLGEKGKMHKALIYSSLEVFIENLNGETIILCDWGSGQGIASMLVLDYIKEKQLDIKVSDVILVDDEIKVLSRAISQVEALAQDDIKIIALKSDDNNLFDKIKSTKNNTTLHLFANDKRAIDFLDIEHDIFDKDFVLCVSNEDQEFVDEVYENFKMFMDVQDLSIKDGKIGRFEKFERVFMVRKVDNSYKYNTPTIDIDNDEIPF